MINYLLLLTVLGLSKNVKESREELYKQTLVAITNICEEAQLESLALTPFDNFSLPRRKSAQVTANFLKNFSGKTLKCVRVVVETKVNFM